MMTPRHRTERLRSGTVVHVFSPATAPHSLVQLQHGFAEYAERYLDEYRQLVPELVERGYEVWAMDLPGHGRSPGPRAVTDVDRAVREHREVRREMRRRERPIVVVGHSLGGLVSAASVADDPGGVVRVVLTSPVILSRTPAPVRLLARLLAAARPAASLPGRPARPVRDAGVLERAAADPLLFHGTTTLRVGATALEVADRLWRRLDRWQTPLTVFHGTLDEAASYRRSAAVVAAIGRPDARLVTVEGGLHELLHDLPGDHSTFDGVIAAIEGRPARGAAAGRVTSASPLREYSTPALTAPTPDANATDLLLERVALTPDLPLFSKRQGDLWVDVSATAFLDEVRALAKGLIAAGIEPGDRIGLLSHTRYEWTLVDFAAWFAGAVIVPIYETSSPFQIGWNLGDSGARALIVESAAHRERYLESLEPGAAAFEALWQIDRGDLTALAASGTAVGDDELEDRRSAAAGADTATIVYTSGTTGNPKGCVLTHSNFVELSRNTHRALGEVFTDAASTVLFLPLAHVFARFISILAVYGGVRVTHEPDTSRLVETLGAFRPTFLLAVPRVFEKVFNASEQKAVAAGTGRVFRWAVDAAIARSKALDAGRIPLPLRLRFAVLDRLVLSKLRAALGGRVEYAVSGSAPLGERLGHFYRGMGVTILEGYGLTESTAPATVNRPATLAVGSVGTPLPGVSVRIADDGEVQLRGVNIFREYRLNAAATEAAFDGEWFRTGDIGQLDESGTLRITGRSKELIVTAGGKNVSPAVLEDHLRSNPLVGQAVVVGDRRPFIAALVTLDVDMLLAWLAARGAAIGAAPAPIGLQDAVQHPLVQAEVQRAVDLANAHVSRAESIRRFVIVPTEFTEASGHLTPKLSIRRNVIVEEFRAEIDALYGG